MLVGLEYIFFKVYFQDNWFLFVLFGIIGFCLCTISWCCLILLCDLEISGACNIVSVHLCVSCICIVEGDCVLFERRRSVNFAATLLSCESGRELVVVVVMRG